MEMFSIKKNISLFKSQLKFVLVIFGYKKKEIGKIPILCNIVQVLLCIMPMED